MNAITTLLIAIAIVAFIFYRQCFRRPFTDRDFLLPLIGALYIAWRCFMEPSSFAVLLVVGSAVFGLCTGLLSGPLINVWRDGVSGIVYQSGGWRYAFVLLALIGVRVLLRLALSMMGIHIDDAVLNDAFIGMAIGNYVGRSIFVGVSAMTIVNGDINVLLNQSQRPLRSRWD